MYFLLKKFTLKKLVSGVKKKFDFTISPLTLGSELLKVRHPLTRDDLVTFFEQQAAALIKDILL